MKVISTTSKSVNFNWRQPWLIFAAMGAVIHFGTAVLRLNIFFPTLKMVEFGAFYGGAWAMRLGLSPYTWSPELLDFLTKEMGLFFNSPPPINPPLWIWLLQPLTLFSFPQASLIWLVLLLILTLWCTVLLARSAGIDNSDWKHIALLFPFVLTFGPSFLNLTLAQNSIFMLIGALLMGRMLLRNRRGADASVIVASIVATAAKLFPAFWLITLPLIRCWRLFFSTILLTATSFAIILLLEPEANQEYWLDILPGRTESVVNNVALDDQSLSAFVDRLGRSHSFHIPGLSVAQQHTVNWTMPWSLPAAATRMIGFTFLGILALGLLLIWFKVDPVDPEGGLYLWVLFSLIVVPHMARYNHILLLPAMAWLWRRDKRNLVAITYLLTGFSRLNHLWAILLPAPWGPLAAGFGLYAVIALGGGIITSIVGER